MKIYLDDIRPAPQGFRRVIDVQTCLAMLRNFDVAEISLDHDLGGEVTGMRVLDHLEERTRLDPKYVPPYVKIHTMNGAARAKMTEAALKINRERSKRLGE